MSIALVTSGTVSTVRPGVTVGLPTINSTGANLIVCSYAYAVNSDPPVLSDSKSNTYVELTQRDNASNIYLRTWYSMGANLGSVGASHTFSLTTTVSTFGTFIVTAWSGVDNTVSPTENGATSGFQPGSITPAVNGALIIAIEGTRSTTAVTIDSGFTIERSAIFQTSDHNGSGQAYLIQSTAAAVNPTWSVTGCQEIAVWQPTGATAAAVRRMMLLGVS